MYIASLWSPDWRTDGEDGDPTLLDGVGARLLERVPRVAVEPRRGVVWADLTGLPPHTAEALHALTEVRVGVAAVPVAAEVAARTGEGDVVRIAPGEEGAFLDPIPLAALGAEEGLLRFLEGVGITRCGPLAALDREAVEVRFGAEGVALWRLARADDRRRLFPPVSRERPSAGLEFLDYVVRDAERLLFAANGLLGSVCGALEERGEHARRLELALSLEGGGAVVRSLGVGRPTGSRERWLRRIRDLLEGIELPDAVTALTLRVEGTEPAGTVQGDLFDRGFATAGAAEAAVARLIDRAGPVAVRPRTEAHPLVERRATWQPRAPEEMTVRETAISLARPASAAPGASGVTDAVLTLQTHPVPRPIQVETEQRRDHAAPIRYREGRRWRGLAVAAGPDRISGGMWEEAAYAREYFRCLDEEGQLLWVYRDGRSGEWFVHGWWG
jgi:protein ImuB